MAQKDKATFDADWVDPVTGDFPTNSVRYITALLLRNSFEDIKDSVMFIDDNFIDEDSFASDSATKAPSQQSVKAYVDSNLSGILLSEVDISSAQILSGNTSPVQLVAAPGANKMIMPVAIVVKLVWNSIAYASNVSWNTKIGSASSPAIGSNGLLDDTQDSYDYFTIFSGISKTTAEWINQPLYWYVLAGNPINGNSTLKVKVLYKIVTF